MAKFAIQIVHGKVLGNSWQSLRNLAKYRQNWGRLFVVIRLVGTHQEAPLQLQAYADRSCKRQEKWVCHAARSVEAPMYIFAGLAEATRDLDSIATSVAMQRCNAS